MIRAASHDQAGRPGKGIEMGKLRKKPSKPARPASRPKAYVQLDIELFAAEIGRQLAAGITRALKPDVEKLTNRLDDLAANIDAMTEQLAQIRPGYDREMCLN
jgi:hypothetical protein